MKLCSFNPSSVVTVQTMKSLLQTFKTLSQTTDLGDSAALHFLQVPFLIKIDPPQLLSYDHEQYLIHDLFLNIFFFEASKLSSNKVDPLYINQRNKYPLSSGMIGAFNHRSLMRFQLNFTDIILPFFQFLYLYHTNIYM